MILGDDEIIEVLRKAVLKWESISEGIGIDTGGRHCTFCELYRDNKCDGCALTIFGYRGCSHPQLQAWWQHQADAHPKAKWTKGTCLCSECRRLARARLAFAHEIFNFFSEGRIE